MSVSLEKRNIDFSIQIGEFVKFLREDGKGFPFCERLLVCAVSAGMALRDGRKDKAVEYLKETDYIMEIAVAAGYITQRQSVHIRGDCESLLKMLNE